MTVQPPNGKNLARPFVQRNARPEVPRFFLDPAIYRVFPPGQRSALVALFNLLIAFGRDPARPVLATQAELAELLGLSVRQVRRYEAQLEDLGAVRIVRDFPGLRGGRAVELVPLEDWIPEEAWKGPRPSVATPQADPFGELPASVDNSARADMDVLRRRTYETPKTGIAPNTARARQSTLERNDQRRDALSPTLQARSMFGFLCRKAGLSGKRWREALPALQAIASELGHEGGWVEIERIAIASRSAIRPGAYAFACLFPDGPPERSSNLLRALDRPRDAGPLFQTLERERVHAAPASPPSARSPAAPTPWSDPVVVTPEALP